MAELEGTVAIVTGAASGIGLAVAHDFARRGVQVTVSDIDVEGGRAQGVKSLSEAGYVLVEGETIRITDAGQQVRDWIEEETDRLYFTPWSDLPPEELDRVYTLLKAVCDAL